MTAKQRQQCDGDGRLFFTDLFGSEEIGMQTSAVPEIYTRREAYNVREKGEDAVRTNFAVHMYSERAMNAAIFLDNATQTMAVPIHDMRRAA